MANNRFKIKVNLQPNLPDDFPIKYEEMDDWHLGKYKPNKDPSNKGMNIKLNAWNEAEILYEDAKFIAGQFTIEADEEIIPFEFMIAKFLYEKSRNKIRMTCPYFNRLSEKELNSFHRISANQLMPECLERMRLYNEFLRQKNKKA